MHSSTNAKHNLLYNNAHNTHTRQHNKHTYTQTGEEM